MGQTFGGETKFGETANDILGSTRKQDQRKVDDMVNQLSDIIKNPNTKLQQKFLLSRIEKSISGQKKIEENLADYLMTYRECKLEDQELHRIAKEAIKANLHTETDDPESLPPPEEMIKRIAKDQIEQEV